MQKTIITNTTKELENAPIFQKVHSVKDQGPPTSAYGPAQSHFQDTILSEIELYSSKEERIPQSLVYGSNPNGFRFKTLNNNYPLWGGSSPNHPGIDPKLRSLKYLNYGFALEENGKGAGSKDVQMLRKFNGKIGNQDRASEDEGLGESRLVTRQAARCKYGINEVRFKLPEMDEEELLMRLRAQPAINRHVPPGGPKKLP